MTNPRQRQTAQAMVEALEALRKLALLAQEGEAMAVTALTELVKLAEMAKGAADVDTDRAVHSDRADDVPVLEGASAPDHRRGDGRGPTTH